MDDLRRIVELALDEDIGLGDVTSQATVPRERQARGIFLAKSDGVVSGLRVAEAVFQQVDPTIDFTPSVRDGERISRGETLASVAGPARSLLAAERVALNFLQRLSGVATATARYVAAVEGTGARVIDTRKTTPGMRALEKAAVRHGGGHNHRFGLSDGILIKDNHLAAIGGPDRIAKAIAAARQNAPHTLRVEVEVTTLEELQQALAAGADIILLDNMSPQEMAEAVRRTAGRALLEASGGIRLESLRAVAETGVDLISSGALTHSSPALDISLEIELV
ncbi:MAG TPA: carboxylating nicotinate-nucleotide diphosphorylase [Thermomicrobiaceae bacterium]|nr:carboxylating nicotinate-nucleotide diphosphorylase [Thermomicrobiaceae bacterium]